MNTSQSACNAAAPAPRHAVYGNGTSGGALMRFAAILFLWRERAMQRRSLGRLDDHLLRDIGVDRATAKQEASKPFWRA